VLPFARGVGIYFKDESNYRESRTAMADSNSLEVSALRRDICEPYTDIYFSRYVVSPSSIATAICVPNCQYDVHGRHVCLMIFVAEFFDGNFRR
jgi:hypothetical protein